MNEYVVTKAFHCPVRAANADEAEDVVERLWDEVVTPVELEIGGEEIIDIIEVG